MICLVRLVQGSRVAYIQQSKFLDLLFVVGQGGNYMYRWPLPVYSIHILRSRPGVHLHLIADFLADLSLRSMSPPLSSEADTDSGSSVRCLSGNWRQAWTVDLISWPPVPSRECHPYSIRPSSPTFVACCTGFTKSLSHILRAKHVK